MAVESIRGKFAEAGRFAEAWHCNMYSDTLSRLDQPSVPPTILIRGSEEGAVCYDSWHCGLVGLGHILSTYSRSTSVRSPRLQNVSVMDEGFLEFISKDRRWEAERSCRS